MIDLLSRISVVAACVFAVVVSMIGSRHPMIAAELKPHLLLVGVWALLCSLGMFSLAFPSLSPFGRWTIATLNAAATMTIGGLAAFVWRLFRRLPR